MKHSSKRLLAILLSLALVLGLVPGMSLTAYATSTETLLTTITATGTEQASYSTAGVATVSFSYTAGGSSAYLANWGWWGYGWSATVNAAEGYNITKCIFYDDANRTATDSEAPFVVETTEDDKAPQVNGTTINSSSKGIKKIEVYGYATPAHTHSFTYAASGATITATCTAGCPDSYDTTPATLTIAAAGGTYDGTTDYGATVTNNIPAVTGDTVGSVAYYKVDTEGATTGGTAQTGAPTDAGYYYASVTLTSGSNAYTAVKAFTVAKADPTAPTGLTATYGQKLSDVALPTGWTWADSTQSVGSVVTPAATFKANFAGDDNYNAASNVDVTVTVSKADNPATVTNTASVTKGGNTVDLANNVTKNGATGDVTYAISDEANGCSLNGSVLTSGNNTGSVTVNVTVAADDNYNALAATPITVTINDKPAQTITAENVTVTYGDTGKGVSGTTSGDGAISYSVKSGDAVTVNPTTGALTILKAGTATITVTAAETATYAAASKDVTVTINTKAMTVSAENVNVTVDGQPHGITVNVTDPTTGYTVKYGTTEGSYTLDASPTQTEAETLTVYYQVTADNYTAYTGSATVTVNAHIHNWSYEANGATINATCGNSDGGHSGSTTATLTISAPAHAVINDGNSAEATVTGGIDGVQTPGIVYKQGETVLQSAPTAAGSYTASITLGTATASVSYKVKDIFTVSFDTGDAPAIPEQQVTEGDKAAQPDDPVLEGWKFGGWFEDATFNKSFSFDTPITATMTVYAKLTGIPYNLVSVSGVTNDSDHKWTKDSGKEAVLTFKPSEGVDNSFQNFIGLAIDGVQKTINVDYTAAQGSTVITLKPATLQALSVGTHTVTAQFTNGTTSTRLTIEAASTSPKTGDGSAPALWLTLMALSALSLGGVTVLRKKED